MNDDELDKIRDRHERADADIRIAWNAIGMKAHEDRAALLAALDATRRDLSNLVCRINRDGGHAMTGDLRADVAAADVRAAETSAALDEARAEVERQRAEIDNLWRLLATARRERDEARAVCRALEGRS